MRTRIATSVVSVASVVLCLEALCIPRLSAYAQSGLVCQTLTAQDSDDFGVIIVWPSSWRQLTPTQLEGAYSGAAFTPSRSATLHYSSTVTSGDLALSGGTTTTYTASGVSRIVVDSTQQFNLIACIPANQVVTPLVTPTPIPTVTLQLGTIITTTQQLALDQVDAWNIGSDSAPLLLGLAALVLGFGLLKLFKGIASWRLRGEE